MRVILVLLFVKSFALAGQLCPEGYTFDDGFGCYLIGNEPLSWFEAYYFCDQREGYLAEIRDEFHQAEVILELESLGGDYWIGLSDSDLEGHFVWSHSHVPAENFTAWSPENPNGNQTENCVAMTKEHHYFWTDESCDDMNRPLCHAPMLLQPCVLPDAFYVAELDRCYVKIDGSFDPSACTSLGPTYQMAELRSSEVVEALKLYSDQISSSVYIGLYRNDSSSEFKWLSGAPLDYTDWSEDYPTDFADHDCVLAQFYYDMTWFNSLCYYGYGNLCEFPKP